MRKIDNFTEEELRDIAANSSSNREILHKLGYTGGGATTRVLNIRCKE